MSYYVTITRRPNPLWNVGEQIDEAEWRRVALSDGEIHRPTDAEAADVAPFARSGDLVWTAHPEEPAVWFVWDRGQIDVRNPDELMLAKMASLASRLGARLISEQGEHFDEQGNSLGVRDLPDEPDNRPWWRRVFARRDPRIRFDGSK